MSEQFTADNKEPIFISYARKDGREIAAKLREDLLKKGFTIWQDVVAMEAGDKWWEQIKAAIEGSATMVLVLTDGALASGVVHDEWTYARTKGTHIIPVTYDKEIYAKAPQWMQQIDIPNLNHTDPDHQLAWTRLLKQLNDPPERKPRPFTVPNLPEHFVERPAKFDALIAHLLDENRQNPIAITTALQGGGGFGKTTLAIALCHDDKVRVAFDDGILWLQFRENMTQAQALDLLNTQNRLLAPDTPNETDITVASSKFRDLLSDRNILIVIDDAWTEQYLRYFIHEKTAYLITTRLQTVVTGAKAQSITVDDMETAEASDLLAKWLPEKPSDDETALLNDLAKRLGEWALLLELVGAELHSLMSSGRSLTDAIDYVSRRFERRGINYLDRTDEQSRNSAISISLEASVSRLPQENIERFYELAIFPEDTPIPFSTIEQLWQATANYDDLDSEDALEAMNRLSLFTRYDVREKALRLHDVVRQVMLEKLDNSAEKHSQLINQWGDLTQLPDIYAWEHIAYHLKEADKLDTLYDLLFSYNFLRNKLEATSPQAIIADCDTLPGEHDVQLLRSAIDMSRHVLSKDTNQVHMQIFGRLIAHRENHPQINRLLTAIQSDDEVLYALPHTQTMQPAGGAILRRLQGHSSMVNDLVIKANIAISASDDKTLIVWNWKTGEQIRTLYGHSLAISGVAIQNEVAISASSDVTLIVWNWKTGEQIRTLYGHSLAIRSVVIQGDIAISASRDKTLIVWDWTTGQKLRELIGHSASVNNLAIQGDYIISTSDDKSLIVWNWTTGQKIRSLAGHLEGVLGITMSGDIAISTSDDKSLIVWNWTTGQKIRSLTGHSKAVIDVEIQSNFAISVSYDGTLIVWDWKKDDKFKNVTGHVDEISCITQQYDHIISASFDNTLIVWNWISGKQLHKITEHSTPVTSVTTQGHIAISVSSDNQILVWNWKTGNKIRSFTGHTGHINCISMEGSHAITASHDKTLIVWHWKTGQKVRTLHGHTDWVSCIKMHDEIAISGSHDNTLIVWNWISGTKICTLTGHSSLI